MKISHVLKGIENLSKVDAKDIKELTRLAETTAVMFMNINVERDIDSILKNRDHIPKSMEEKFKSIYYKGGKNPKLMAIIMQSMFSGLVGGFIIGYISAKEKQSE